MIRTAVMCIGLLSSFSVTASALQAQTVGRVAQSAAGAVGQRQRREDVAPEADPMQRINNRVANRVESRMRNRIDRYYDPRANTTSPFKDAAAQAEAGGRSRR